jgi:pimeloyl-ACP methyl ester carboxylesterase
MKYPREQYCVGQDTSVLQADRKYDKYVEVRPDLPCNVIVIHGVNDVGTSFAAVEEGLCAGLDVRMLGAEAGKRGRFVSANYRMPTAEDKDKVEPDPDAVFFKRKIVGTTYSPVIPFYWGFREVFNKADTKNGQRTDRFGNRLDKDLAKGGGPFGNATSTLPDMWNHGLSAPLDVVGDAVRPLLSAPGRMYMVLAAKRLAALITMIRDYDANDAVSIVAHSQGCLISLLAQALLLDEGQRPADTLILTHPPYSLDEETNFILKGLEKLPGGTDAAMDGHYAAINARQTFDARLRTLVNIVQGVVAKKHTTPALSELTDHGKYHGMVGAKWSAGADRDNRGKVYLYFCPEDMTVALDNIKGIGWQGVPDYMSGTALSKTKREKEHSIWGDTNPQWATELQHRKPMAELGPGFFQRVFTSKQRFDLTAKKVAAVLVGQVPHDFALRIEGEDDHAHVAAANRGNRANHDEAVWPPKPGRWDFLQTEVGKRDGIRTINGEALHVPAPADLRGSGQIDPKNVPQNSAQAKLPAKDQGPYEEIDPIDAAIAITSGRGINAWREECPDPSGAPHRPGSPQKLPLAERKLAEERYNKDKDLVQLGPEAKRTILELVRYPDGKVVALVQESPNEARKRWQHEVSAKSFHGAIIGSAANHRNVTAYDVAIGGGQASSDPKFYAYLCAVADWRLQSNKRAPVRLSIIRWEKFVVDFASYLNVEPTSRKELISGNARYYSTGELPACIAPLHTGLPSSVVCETIPGTRTARAPTPGPKQTNNATGNGKKGKA